jgi:UDP-2-acetamido-3-amino-2,3-dideoxy-glucuronate N-acetyltransferase
MAGTEPFIHPSAIVDPGAEIGEGTRVWHFSHIMTRSRIGINCTIGQNVYIDKNVVIGNQVKIQNNVSVYDGVTVEDDVFLGPSVVFTNVTNPRSFIDRRSEFKKTNIRKGATIGANATILCGVEIGSYALIGAGSVVTHDVKPYALVFGNPANFMGWVSRAGLKLEFNSEAVASCPQTGEKYQVKNDMVSRIG